MKKRTKIIIRVIIGICIVFLFFLFWRRDFDSFVTASDVNEIVITDGNNGDTMTVKNETDIDKILDYMDNIAFRRKFVLPRGGWSYRFNFYNGGELLGSFVFATTSGSIDGKDYSYRDSNSTTMEEMLTTLTNSIFKEVD